MAQKKKICLLSAGHIASNPRLVKEADALHAAGYDVLALGWQNLERIGKLDRTLESSRSWKIFNVRWNFLHRAKTRFSRRQNLNRVLSGDDSLECLANALAPWSSFYLKEIRQFKPDLVIAHNIPSLAIAALVKEQLNIPYAFDLEDYHPGERKGGMDDANNSISHLVLKQCLSSARYVTASSPGIASEAAREFNCEIQVVLNVFSIPDKTQQPLVERKKEGLSIYWFSQVIGLDRGVDDVLKACSLLKGNFQLHLRGTASKETLRSIRSKAEEGQYSKQCFIHSQIPPDELPFRTLEHDVGLSLEPGFSLNNNIAIGNKIFMYLACGLATVVSNTPGQAWVYSHAPDMGFIYEPGDFKSMAEGLQKWIDRPELLAEAKRASQKIAQEQFCWDKEKIKFLSLVSKIC
jgi:glycosyltransferase involved in cell wall biosynthesis